MFRFFRKIDYKKDLENKIFMVETAIKFHKERMERHPNPEHEQGVIVGLNEALHYMKMGA